MIALLGLPGLYQNWLMAALDPKSIYLQPNSTNFNTKSRYINWYQKLETDIDTLSNYECIVNTYVHDENFVWYLYNFFEKTDNINIKICSFINDIKHKAVGTYAFHELHDHLYQSYNFDQFTNVEYQTNAAIEYFYFLLLNQNSKFKQITSLTDSSFINIEYMDFSNIKVLESKICDIKTFEPHHFYKMYRILLDTNTVYINKYQNFVSKFANCKNFDILETAYLGLILTKQTGIVYDWFNEDVRNHTLTSHWDHINQVICNNKVSVNA